MSRTARMGATGTLAKAPGLSETLGHKSVVEKQRAAIDKLRQQNAQLKEDLLLENKFSMRPSNPGAAALINKLQDEADLYTRKIQLEHRKVLMLQQQLGQARAKLGGTRTAMGGIFSAKEKSQALAKQVKVLENRLEKQFVKYNEAITHNKQLREQVDNLRRERLMFEAINASLDRELSRIRRHIADTITAANETHAGKDKALAEAAALKLGAEKEHAAFEEEWRQLSHIIEEDRRSRDAARQVEMAERERRTQELLKSCEASAASHKKAVRSSWAIGMNKALAQNVSHDKVRLLTAAFAEIQQATGIQDIEELVSSFAAAEDASYGLYAYVCALNGEVEGLEDGIARVRAEIEANAAQARAAEASAAASAGTAAARCGAAEAKASAYEARLGGAARAVDRLKRGVAALFDVAGCNTDHVRALLGDEDLAESNLLAHLGVIEQRSNELLQAFALSQPGNAALQELLRAQPLSLAGGGPGGVRIVVDPPSAAEQPPGGAALASCGFGSLSGCGGGSVGAPGLAGGGLPPSGASGLLLDQDGASGDAALPDDVPLTRAQLQAKVSKNLDAILERSLKVRPAGASSCTRRR